MSHARVSLLAAALAACAPADPPGYDQPASALHDPQADVYLVSNVCGAPLAKDGNGYIARVAPEANSMQRHWIAGGKNGVTLHAPKGMAISGDMLFVADIDVVRMFERETGRARGGIAIPGATSLDDVAAAPDGAIYVTDSGLDASLQPARPGAIWRVSWRTPLPANGFPIDFAPRVEPLTQDPGLGQPRGVVVHKDGIYFVSGRDGAFELVDRRGTRTLLAKAGEPLTGLARIEPRADESPVWLATSTTGRCVYQFDVMGNVTKLPRTLDAPGDCAFDAVRRRLLVPLTASDQLALLQL